MFNKLRPPKPELCGESSKKSWSTTELNVDADTLQVPVARLGHSLSHESVFGSDMDSHPVFKEDIVRPESPSNLKSQNVEPSPVIHEEESYFDIPVVESLVHPAALHKIAVRPRRVHRKKLPAKKRERPQRLSETPADENGNTDARTKSSGSNVIRVDFEQVKRPAFHVTSQVMGPSMTVTTSRGKTLVHTSALAGPPPEQEVISVTFDDSQEVSSIEIKTTILNVSQGSKNQALKQVVTTENIICKDDINSNEEDEPENEKESDHLLSRTDKDLRSEKINKEVHNSKELTVISKAFENEQTNSVLHIKNEQPSIVSHIPKEQINTDCSIDNIHTFPSTETIHFNNLMKVDQGMSIKEPCEEEVLSTTPIQKEIVNPQNNIQKVENEHSENVDQVINKSSCSAPQKSNKCSNNLVLIEREQSEVGTHVQNEHIRVINEVENDREKYTTKKVQNNSLSLKDKIKQISQTKKSELINCVTQVDVEHSSSSLQESSQFQEVVISEGNRPVSNEEQNSLSLTVSDTVSVDSIQEMDKEKISSTVLNDKQLPCKSSYQMSIEKGKDRHIIDFGAKKEISQPNTYVEEKSLINKTTAHFPKKHQDSTYVDKQTPKENSHSMDESCKIVQPATQSIQEKSCPMSSKRTQKPLAVEIIPFNQRIKDPTFIAAPKGWRNSIEVSQSKPNFVEGIVKKIDASKLPASSKEEFKLSEPPDNKLEKGAQEVIDQSHLNDEDITSKNHIETVKMENEPEVQANSKVTSQWEVKIQQHSEKQQSKTIVNAKQDKDLLDNKEIKVKPPALKIKSDKEPELLRVFARRSIKQKSPEKPEQEFIDTNKQDTEEKGVSGEVAKKVVDWQAPLNTVNNQEEIVKPCEVVKPPTDKSKVDISIRKEIIINKGNGNKYPVSNGKAQFILKSKPEVKIRPKESTVKSSKIPNKPGHTSIAKVTSLKETSGDKSENEPTELSKNQFEITKASFEQMNIQNKKPSESIKKPEPVENKKEIIVSPFPKVTKPLSVKTVKPVITSPKPQVTTPPIVKSEVVKWRGQQNCSNQVEIEVKAPKPPDSNANEEKLQRAQSFSPASATSPADSKQREAVSGPEEPSWRQLANQRRESRVQRERLLLGSTAQTYVLESSGSKTPRSSKVWSMVSNIQKLQMT